MVEIAAGIVGAAAGAYHLAVSLSDWAERSCHIEIDNMTADAWELVRKGNTSGGFQEPTANWIKPFDNVIISAVSGSFGEGAVGNLGFRARDVVLLMDYSNPVVGANDLDASFEGPRGGEFQLATTAGPGNKNALFRCTVAQPAQDTWRFCPKCHGLFGLGPGSVCPAGGPHDPLGWEYVLLHDVPEGPTLQAGWRFCPKCHGLVSGGDSANSRCPAGGPHDTNVGWNYNVPHDLEGGPRLQRGWRFCPKCHGLVSGGDSANSRCPAGGPHDTNVGWVYNMAHRPV